ncbi:MAG: hypothetical protein SGPRY_006670 [Prymnesium sp.]
MVQFATLKASIRLELSLADSESFVTGEQTEEIQTSDPMPESPVGTESTPEERRAIACILHVTTTDY